jgi:hypothetical protein
MLASQTAVNRHGPLELLGCVDEEVIDEASMPTILAMIDVDCFATIPGDMARHLERAVLRMEMSD